MEPKRYSEDDFNDFLKELLTLKRFNDAKEEGIVKLVINEGFNSLSSKQQYVFENSIRHYIYEECSRCGNDIPWSEMSAAEDNGKMCSWCQQLSKND